MALSISPLNKNIIGFKLLEVILATGDYLKPNFGDFIILVLLNDRQRQSDH